MEFYCKLLVLFALFAFPLQTVEGVVSGPSKDCEDEILCISLRNCEPYMNLLKTLEKPLKPSVVEFLRSRQCGFQSGYPKVCCKALPSSLNIFKTDKKQEKSIKLTAIIDGVSDSKKELIHNLETRTTSRPKTTISLKEKSEMINKAFSEVQLFGLGSEFDFFRKKKSILDIEIR